MKIGIGIDTGGTCTDAVVYQFEDKKILAYGKTPTTKEDLSVGIGKALDQLPRELVDQAEVVALSTTLATNACVENKGGRAKLILFGMDRDVVGRVGEEYGLAMDSSLIFIDCKTRPTGQVIREPDWDDFKAQLHDRLDDCDAVGVVEMYARKSGANMEKKAAEIIKAELGIPVVCGHALFSETNIVKRGASALLNARLLSVIEAFLAAVKKAMEERNIKAPFVIVRSDGSLMNGEFTSTRPVETLLCGPVASVMGAAELSDEENALVVDIGGTTTDIAFVKNGIAQQVKNGVRIGKWSTFVKGLFVDTFGLGGDSGVILDDNKRLVLQDDKVVPLCMAASSYPQLKALLKREAEDNYVFDHPQKQIFVRIKDISDNPSYTETERFLAGLLETPKSLEELKAPFGGMVVPSLLQRLISEAVIIRCGVTPTDVMHVKGDFVAYDTEAARYGLETFARLMRVSVEEACDKIFDEFKRKLYCNIVRIIIEDSYPEIGNTGVGEQLKQVINDSYDQAKAGKPNIFAGIACSTPATLVGVGAPTRLFIGDVAKLLGTNSFTSEYSGVANALGAVVGKVSATVSIEVNYNPDTDQYIVTGCGERVVHETRGRAEAYASELAHIKAREEVMLRGADGEDLSYNEDIQDNSIETEFGTLYVGYTVNVTASGKLRLN